VEHARFKDLFEAEHVNEKSTATKGVKKIVSLKFISNGARTLLERNDILHAATKRLYDVLGLSKIFNARITFGSEHEKPTGDYRKKIESILKQ